jgi:hypothetical protein
MCENPKINELFKSIDNCIEQNLHQKYGSELELLIKEKEINTIQRNYINEFHFSAMELIMKGGDPTIAYRRGIRKINKISAEFKTNIIEKILKIMKDDTFCENSQLKLFLNLVKMFTQENIHLLTEDDVKMMVNNWVEEIKPDEKIIIKNNEDYIFIPPMSSPWVTVSAYS